MQEIKVGVYIPSCGRYDKIITHHLIPYGVYVVRESEREQYIKALGDENLVWSVEDEKINSLAKVRQYIIDNSKEDVIVQVDDDITKFVYNNKQIQQDLDNDMVEMELCRIAQLIYDLKIGHASLSMRAIPLNYNQEFQFSGLTGGVCWYNKKGLKSVYETTGNTYIKEDTDFVLQELLNNRIVLIPKYLCMISKVDTNKGGNQSGKTINAIKNTVEYLKNKWGKYYDHDFDKNISYVRVKR